MCCVYVGKKYILFILLLLQIVLLVKMVGLMYVQGCYINCNIQVYFRVIGFKVHRVAFIKGIINASKTVKRLLVMMPSDKQTNKHSEI